MKILKESDKAIVKTIEQKIKNKWSWKWTSEKVSRDIPRVGPVSYTLGECFVKIDIAGVAYCTWCDDKVSYGGNGKKHLISHCNTDKHVEKVKVKCTNYSLGGTFSGEKDAPSEKRSGGKLFSIFNKPSLRTIHGSGNSVSPQENSSSSMPSKLDPLIPLADRTANMEALFLSVACEHSLPLSVIPALVDLAKECSRDPKALAAVRLSKMSASYKLKYGVAKTMCDETILKMKSTPFSLNIDESTSGHGKKILALMASFFDSSVGNIVVQHLASVELVLVNSKAVYGAIVDVIEEYELPWNNLVSVLFDSCNVMRGCKSGVEVLLKKKAPQLIDIDGDSCHHVHNIAKSFCKPFVWWIERLFNDLHMDFKYCSQYKELMMELCRMGNVNFTVPQRFVSHRWLSAYDQALNTARLLEIYMIFYSAFLPLHLQNQYSEMTTGIIQKLETRKARQRARDIVSTLKVKSMTKEGIQRKERIVKRLFEHQGKTLVILHLYISVLHILKQFILKFQSKQPLIHKLHVEQEQLARKFLCCFVKPEAFSSCSAKDLKKLQLKQHLVKPKHMFKGPAVEEILKGTSLSSSQKEEFLKNVEEAYVAAGQQLLNKLPLGNKMLHNLSALDGDLRQHHHIKRCMEQLVNSFSYLYSDEERQTVSEEILAFSSNDTLPEIEDCRIDVWWEARISYPCLQKLAKAALSAFHGPQVESAFNLMKDTLGSKSGSMGIGVLSSFQTAKYFLKSKGSTAVSYFTRPDILHTPISPSLVKNICSSAKMYKNELRNKQVKLNSELSAVALSRKHMAFQTAAAAKRLREKAVKQSFSKHQKQSLKRKEQPSSSSWPAKVKRRRL